MSMPRISKALNEIDEELISGAANRRKPYWKTWGILAACLTLAVIMGAGLLLGRRTETATLSNGNTITFVKNGDVGRSQSLDMDVTIKPLTGEEVASLFGDLPVTADAIFAGSSPEGQLLGFEGTIGDVKMVISTSDVPLLDTIIDGTEKTCEINGISIAAGYFVTDPNSKGEQNAIYYATFEIQNCTVYLENGGAKENSEVTKTQLAETIQQLMNEVHFYNYREAVVGIEGTPNA